MLETSRGAGRRGLLLPLHFLLASGFHQGPCSLPVLQHSVSSSRSPFLCFPTIFRTDPREVRAPIGWWLVGGGGARARGSSPPSTETPASGDAPLLDVRDQACQGSSSRLLNCHHPSRFPFSPAPGMAAASCSGGLCDTFVFSLPRYQLPGEKFFILS